MIKGVLRFVRMELLIISISLIFLILIAISVYLTSERTCRYDSFEQYGLLQNKLISEFGCRSTLQERTNTKDFYFFQRQNCLANGPAVRIGNGEVTPSSYHDGTPKNEETSDSNPAEEPTIVAVKDKKTRYLLIIRSICTKVTSLIDRKLEKDRLVEAEQYDAADDSSVVGDDKTTKRVSDKGVFFKKIFKTALQIVLFYGMKRICSSYMSGLGKCLGKMHERHIVQKKPEPLAIENPTRIMSFHAKEISVTSTNGSTYRFQMKSPVSVSLPDVLLDSMNESNLQTSKPNTRYPESQGDSGQYAVLPCNEQTPWYKNVEYGAMFLQFATVSFVCYMKCRKAKEGQL